MANGLDNIRFKASRLSDQIKDTLKKAIEESTFKVGDTLPSVQMLAEHFKVSTVTVREALRGLEEEDLIEFMSLSPLWTEYAIVCCMP